MHAQLLGWSVKGGKMHQAKDGLTVGSRVAFCGAHSDHPWPYRSRQTPSSTTHRQHREPASLSDAVFLLRSSQGDCLLWRHRVSAKQARNRLVAALFGILAVPPEPRSSISDSAMTIPSRLETVAHASAWDCYMRASASGPSCTTRSRISKFPSRRCLVACPRRTHSFHGSLRP